MTSEIIYKFQEFLAEAAKAEEKKTTKEVNEKETAGYDYKDKKNLNNQIFDQYINGLRVEMEKDPKLTIDEAREVVAKNLEKDPIFYTKNAAFKVDGLGYEELKQQEEPKGKYKSSGYGDLKENDMKELNNFKNFLLTEEEFQVDPKKHPYVNVEYEMEDGKLAQVVKVKGNDLIFQAMQGGKTYYMSKPTFDQDLKKGSIKVNPEDIKKSLNGNPKSALDTPNFVWSGFKEPKLSESTTSDKLKELLEEAVAGIPSIGNPFANRKKEAYENSFEAFLAEENKGTINDPKGSTAHGNIAEEDDMKEGEAAYEYEKGKSAGEKEEKKKMKKEGRMKMSEVLKEAERLGEIARKKVESKIYERAIEERKRAMSINEDESLSEFINQEAIKEVEKEIKELEKKLMEVIADKNTMTGGK
jgi:predicted HicB family RNase H-like nuclease